MDSWHATFLGLRHLPREITAFEIEVFFRFWAAERRVIEERRRPELKLGLALQIGFARRWLYDHRWVLLAYGVTNVAATVGYKIGLEGTSIWVPPVWGPVLGFVIGAPLLFLLPLFMLTRQLYRTKRSAKRLYRRRVMEQARLFEAQVLPKSAAESATIAGAVDLSLM